MSGDAKLENAPTVVRQHQEDVKHLKRSVGTGRVEERRDARPTGSRSFPLPAHQTGRADFPHPAFRLDFISRLTNETHPDSTPLKNAQPLVDRIPREAGMSAARPHLMTSPEVMPHAFVHVIRSEAPAAVTESECLRGAI